MLRIETLTSGPGTPSSSSHKDLPHVLFVIDGFPKALGGGERVVLRLAAMLPRYGFRASILTLGYHPESAFRLEDAPCPVYLLPLTNTFGLGALQGALALRSFLRDESVAIVQTFFESSDLWAGAVTRLFSRTKLIWSRRDMGILRGKKHDMAYRALRRFPHAMFAVSARVAQHVIEVDRVPNRRVHVIHNGLDLGPMIRKEARAPEQAPVITTIGNIRRVKGHDLLIRAVPRVLAQFPTARFTIAGEVLEPAFFAELQALVEHLGVQEHVFFLGKITDQQTHLRGSDVFVLPSRSEGFSNALIEAMASGLPCIASDVGGNAEAIETDVSGIIVPPGEFAPLADAIVAVLRDSSFALELSVAGQRAVGASFSSDAMLGRVTEAYRSLLS